MTSHMRCHCYDANAKLTELDANCHKAMNTYKQTITSNRQRRNNVTTYMQTVVEYSEAQKVR